MAALVFSGTGKLNSADWWKTLVMGTLGAALGGGYSVVAGDGFTGSHWRPVAVGGIAAGLGYFLKQLGTNDQGQLLGIPATGPKLISGFGSR